MKLTDLGVEAIKASPPVAAIAANSNGYTLQDWVWIATLAYIALQAGWLLWKWWKAAHTDGWRGE